MEITIRNARIEDFEDIFILFEQLWPDKELNFKSLRTVFERGMKSQSDEYICAELDNKVIGFCALAIVNNFWQEGYIAYIYSMIVEDSFRGKGVGTSILEKAFDIAKQRDCKRVELDSGFPREKAHKFYETLGFEKRAFLFSKIIL